ncbi:MAG: sulfotransferase domain-containing protein [Alphaproteobacteria bacterium]|jgi:hypothetical protein|nr:sulfotransferase domain-containing protein [Alphaproteobacteria bacterium]MBN9558920.1 sulfotransferase domain-containing protein [Alphaproteobacteria bacterium]MBN9568886.1 sulfotransferase domain-containing protein [Alphaproteobacteria bacterium]MBN9571960.1 sulfotransferase domain-containing protein [Alphaproteobacteria bacterium]MBN9577824.1 sulfotransferase domain-containing protein [Alphaproteobacteria bacterium]
MAVFNPKSIELLFQEPRSDGQFAGEALLHMRRLGKKRRAIVLAFPPKSAGTYLRSAIVFAANGQLVRAVHAQGGRDAQPYLPVFLSYFEGGVTNRTLVAHLHMQALPANIHFLEAFDIRPVVMIRNIPDMLASFWDMLETDSVARLDGLNCRIPQNFTDMPRADKADFIVDILGPWYASFFATWFAYAEQSPERVCFLTYDEFRADPAETLARALAHAGVEQPQEVCEQALETVWEKRADFRFNKGETGRGLSYFSSQQIDRLRRQLGHYEILAPHIEMLLRAGGGVTSH